MADPKVFTGPAGYTFTLYNDARPAVIVAHPGAPLDQGQFIPLAELGAFLQTPEAAAAFEALAPATSWAVFDQLVEDARARMLRVLDLPSHAVAGRIKAP